MQEIILFMDNNPRFLEVQSRLLEQLGYKVLRALTLAEAEEKLTKERIHLAIFDIRMEDEDDGQDISGLLLAQNKAFQPIPKIILTAHTDSRDTYKYARDVLGPTEDGLPPAVNFIGKDEGPETLIQAVERAFRQYVHINWNLVIRWEKAGSFAHLAEFIAPTASTHQRQQVALEIEDLFRKLFSTYDQITLGRPLFAGNGQVILELFAYPQARGEEQYVLACGDRQCMTAEAERYEQFIRRQSSTGRLEKVESEQTVHCAVVAYTLTGTKLEDVKPFQAFYQSTPIDAVHQALNHLFGTVLKPWHKTAPSVKRLTTVQEWIQEWLASTTEMLVPTTLTEPMATLCRAISEQGLASVDYRLEKLSVAFGYQPAHLFTNPITYLAKTPLLPGLSTHYGITHGQLRHDTLLVNSQQQTYLVHFSQTAYAPLLRDFVSLELSVKVDLLDTLDLQLRYELERRLFLMTTLEQTINTDALPPELSKALSTVRQIRQMAAAQVDTAIIPYLLGLCIETLKRLVQFEPTRRYNRRELAGFAHCYMMAAMLCDKLAETAEALTPVPPQALRSLWIDDRNKEAWVEGKRIELTPQDFDLLAYLYQHRGQLCSRQAIVRTVFGVEYEEADELMEIERSRLNSAISRLRQKLEPDLDNPQYLVTVRGQGYKLISDPIA